MKSIRQIALLAFAALIVCSATAAGDTARRTLVVASEFNEEPYAFLNADGNPSGFNVDVIRAVASASGMEVRFEKTGPTQAQFADVVLGAYYSDGPQPAIKSYCEPLTLRDHAVFVRKDSLYRNLQDLAGRAFTSPDGSKALPWLESHGFGSGIVRTPSFEKAFQLLAESTCEAVIGDRYQGLAALQSTGLDDLRLLPDSVVPTQYGFALASEEPELTDALNAGLTVVRNTGQFERLRAKWLARLDPVPGKISLGGAYSVLLWLVIPGVLLCIGATISTLSFRKQAALRIAALEAELAEARKAFHDLAYERARQRYVINRLSTVSLVDQIAEASRH